MIKPLIFSTRHKAYLSVTFLWYLKFCFEKNFAFCLILNWEQPKLSPSDKSFRFFFLSVTSKKHFACGVSVCLPDGHFLRLAQGKRFCLMRSELTWPEQAAGEDQGTGVISRLTLQTQGPGPSQRRWEPPRHHATMSERQWPMKRCWWKPKPQEGHWLPAPLWPLLCFPLLFWTRLQSIHKGDVVLCLQALKIPNHRIALMEKWWIYFPLCIM